MTVQHSNAKEQPSVWRCALLCAAVNLVFGVSLAEAEPQQRAPTLASPSQMESSGPIEEGPVEQEINERFAPYEQTPYQQAGPPAVAPPPSAITPACDAPYEEELAMHWDEPIWRPFDWLRDLGFRHSSTHGRHVGRGVPLERSSWLNRPFYFDTFFGPLISDHLAPGVDQSNDLFGGVRFGWDFDYYWGVQTRLGWSNPDILYADSSANALSGTYFVGDVDLLYYPWGDTKVRPYTLLGLGMANVGSIYPDGTGNEVTLLGMPFGAGVIFPQTPWLAWRLEFLDNLAFGDNGVQTMNNLSFTAGLELRLGARPRSYWPWRSSRNLW